MIGGSLKALICGSAPTESRTQLYFRMLGIPVLQGYGLTETTALALWTIPNTLNQGEWDRQSAASNEVGENEEIMVRGPKFFQDIGIAGRNRQSAGVMAGSIPAIRRSERRRDTGALSGA